MPDSTQPAALFAPVKIGAIECANRVFMAPLTRCRSTPGSDAPHALNATYYRQRASAGLIVSEATQISAQGKGYMGAPGIYSPEQEAGWKLVTAAVHEAGGKIVAQLWHVGAVSHPDLQPDGQLPVSPSGVLLPGNTSTPNGKRERVAPRALATDEIPGLIADYRHAAEVARRAGFDGVEIHGANGYLLEQFLRDSTNHRSDEYGGSIENRMRLTLAVVDAASEVFGADRVGIRLSPVTLANNCPPDSNPQALYGALVESLSQRRIAFLHFIEGNTQVSRTLDGFDFHAARRQFGGRYIANNGYTREMALAAIDSGAADAIAFGRDFLSNPDLPRRLLLDAPLNPLNARTLYKPGAEGYTDYPAL